MSKKITAILAGLSIISAINLGHADEGRGIYLGAFGGVGITDNQNVEQTGVAHKIGTFNDGLTDFDLLVDVKGKAKRKTSGLAGVQLGYEWASMSSKIKPAFELEMMYLGASQNSNLANPNTEGVANTTATGSARDAIDTAVASHYGAGEHTFQNHTNMKIGLLMANGVFTYETNSMFKPYAGVGIGLALVNMTSASSLQTNPLLDGSSATAGCETTVGGGCVNHFNSKTKSSDYALAGQVKLGLRAEVNKNVSAFVEYRYLHIDSTEFTYGSTVYADHPPTDNWNYKNSSMDFHDGLIGIAYAF